MALFQRTTKTRSTAVIASISEVEFNDAQPAGEGSVTTRMTLKFNCDDGKRRSISLYGEELYDFMKLVHQAECSECGKAIYQYDSGLHNVGICKQTRINESLKNLT